MKIIIVEYGINGIQESLLGSPQLVEDLHETFGEFL